MVLQSDQAFAAWVQPPNSMDNFEISLLEQVKRWIKIKRGRRKIVCMCAATQKFKMNPFQQSHFRQKEENELGNEINNGDLKHLLPKKKKGHVHKMPHSLSWRFNPFKVYAQQAAE